MKHTALIAMLAFLPQHAMADAYTFYYAECLQNAAVINAMPNADGTRPDKNDHSSIVDPANPELYRFCRYRASEQAEARK